MSRIVKGLKFCVLSILINIGDNLRCEPFPYLVLHRPHAQRLSPQAPVFKNTQI